MKTIDYYNKHAEEYCLQTVMADMQLHYDAIKPYIKKGTALLDLGCGSGRDSNYFRKLGCNVISVDGSIEMCSIANRLFNLNAQNIDFSQLDYSNAFEVVWACASLLHVPRNEIDNVLQRIYRALRENGILYASFKYGNAERVDGERFYNDYDENSVKELFCKNKRFQVLHIWITKDVRDDYNQKWINVLCKRI